MSQPSMQTLDLFRAVEDIHELAGAIVVLLTDREGTSIAVSGDEDEIPSPLRAVVSGRRLTAAGGVVALLEPISPDLADCPLNFSILPIFDDHVLLIAFDVNADLETVQTVGREGAAMISEILRPVPPVPGAAMD